MIKINFKIVSLLTVLSASIYADYSQEMETAQRCTTYITTPVRLSISPKEMDECTNTSSLQKSKSTGEKSVVVAENDISTQLQNALKGTGQIVWQALAAFESDAIKYHLPILDSKLGDLLITAIRTPMTGISYEEWFSRIGSKIANSYGLNVGENLSLQTAISLISGNKAYQAAFTAAVRTYSPMGAYVFEEEIAKILELTPGYVQWLFNETKHAEATSTTANVTASEVEPTLLEEQQKDSSANTSLLAKAENVWNKFTFSVKKGVQQVKSAMTWENAKSYTAQKGKRVLKFFGLPLAN